MAFEVSIKITTEAQLEAVKATEAAVQKMSNTAKQVAAQSANLNILGPGMIETVKGSRQAAQAIEGLHLSVRPLRGALSFAATSLAGLGEAGGLAAHAIAATATESGGAGIALGALAVTMGILVSRIEQARARFRELSEIELAALARETKGLQLEQDVRQRVKLLEAEGDKIRELAVQAEQLRTKLGKEGVPAERIEQLINKQFANTLREEIAAINRMDAVTATNTLRRKENALAADEQALANARLVQAGDNVIAALERQVLAQKQLVSAMNAQIKFIDSAEKAARGGEVGGILGGEVGGLRKQAGDIFKVGGEVDRSTLDRMFSQLQALKDISQQKFGFDVPPDLAAKLADTEQRLNTIADTAGIKLTVDLLDAGAKFTEVERKLSAIGEAAKIKFNVDTLAAIGQLDDLRAKAAVPIIQEVKVVTSGSPTLPFSDYFGSYAPGVIADFARKAGDVSMQLDTNFSQAIIASLSRMAELQRDIAAFNAPSGFRASIIGDFNVGRVAELEALRRNIGFLSSFGGRPAAGAGGGGGVTHNITIDMRDALITGDVIQGNLLPELRSLIRQTTGKDPGFRVLS